MDTTDRGIVLLDVSGDAAAFDRSILERMEHEAVVCAGPPHGALCPLLAGEGCDKFERAHGILFALDLDRAQHRAILEAYRALADKDLPIRVVARPEQVERFAELLEPFEVLTHEPTVADLDGFAARVEAADR